MIDILLVDDSAQDLEFAREALSELGLGPSLRSATSAEDALVVLKEGPLPDVLLLDLNLPGMSGLDLLGIIRKDPELQRLPVIVLTSSQREEDVLKAYEAYCNAYVRKPLGYEKILRNFEAIKQFWLQVATLPGHSRARMTEPPESERF